jgi:hypothetical protein
MGRPWLRGRLDGMSVVRVVVVGAVLLCLAAAAGYGLDGADDPPSLGPAVRVVSPTTVPDATAETSAAPSTTGGPPPTAARVPPPPAQDAGDDPADEADDLDDDGEDAVGGGPGSG